MPKIDIRSGRFFGLMNMRTLLLAACSVILIGCSGKNHKSAEEAPLAQRPNVVLIFADDLGFGDVNYYNPNSKIPTPNIDQLAKEGLAFSDAHTPAPICGPSRYGVLTGRYSWRNPGGFGNGHDYDPIKIEPGRLTLANVFQHAGYNTAQIGKWGLRYDYASALKDPTTEKDSITPDSFDFSKPILGPNLRGFDYSFAAVTLTDGKKRTLPGVGKWYFENGMSHNGRKPEPGTFDYSRDLKITTDKLVDYIRSYASSDPVEHAYGFDREKPFFIYFDTISPHLPYAPQQDFIGKSDAGEFGDLVVELDFRVGEIITALKVAGLYDETIIIFTSDNGPENNAYERIQNYGHFSMGPWRGVKTHMWEGGTRVPFIIKGPGLVGEGKWIDQPMILTDVLATFADMFGYDIPEGAAEDSESFLPLLHDAAESVSRKPIIYQNMAGGLAIRDGDWVLIDAQSGAAGGRPEPQWFRDMIDVKPHTQSKELFDLKTDPQQRNNLYSDRPEIAARLLGELQAIKQGEGGAA